MSSERSRRHLYTATAPARATNPAKLPNKIRVEDLKRPPPSPIPSGPGSSPADTAWFSSASGTMSADVLVGALEGRSVGLMDWSAEGIADG